MPDIVALLVKVGEPLESTLWSVDPVFVHVQVTVVPTVTVSTAGFRVPLCSLEKKMFPIVTVPGAPPPPGVGPVLLLEQPTTPAAVSISNFRRRFIVVSSPVTIRNDLPASSIPTDVDRASEEIIPSETHRCELGCRELANEERTVVRTGPGDGVHLPLTRSVQSRGRNGLTDSRGTEEDVLGDDVLDD